MKSQALTDRIRMGQELTPAARAERTQALKRKRARTNQKPPVSKKRPIAACNRKKGWERNRVKDRYRTWVKRTKRQGKDKRRSGRVSRAGSRAIKDKERTVIALNSMGKRKSRKGNRGRKCINKTSQTGVQ